MKNYLKIVDIDENSVTPKYLQLINSIIRGIESGKIEKDDILPSIYDFSIALETSRNTIERAYKELKKMNIVQSITGKWYFIANTNFNQPVKILLLFNKLSSHKKIIYDAFVSKLSSSAAIDFYIYNNDFSAFKKLINEKIDQYSKFVIIPHFIESPENTYEVIDNIPKNKLILMDKLESGVKGEFGAVYEDFEQDIFRSLEQLLEKLSKYQTLKIIFPEHSYYSKGILTGFLTFCYQYAFDYEILPSLEMEVINKGTVYINLMEDDLIELIEKIMAARLSVGVDVGVISYNETPLKKFLLDGITTISTDFKLMGEKAAELVLSNSTERIAIPFKVTTRNSL
ncbi:substrate-binding domain-containing protein [Mucilaginibacter sp. SP1R1]|uniref:substrate-binding domain-containing protein n=1 Tax=Mucilaginibacter sp. SP1R1 TaxID=2723091 RepID=UPI00161F8E66|nr:substrate-binding domain-containing protein [Mucilaginibacter sp. SP1R1]MBB6149999.1 DNA-binding transcriptional regulator YhcF (GntR family) [Mucilaginibacter sp. SP1R1]